MYTYSVLRNTNDETFVLIGDPAKEYPKDYRLREGHELTDEWPDGVTYFFSRDRPEGMVLTDYLTNYMGLLIASPRLQTLLRELNAAGIEFLPVVLKNHKKRVASQDYCVVNFSRLTPVINRDRSVVKVSALDDEQVRRIDKVVLREDVAAAGPPFLRMAEMPMTVLFRDDVVEAVCGNALTGMEFVSTDEFKTHG